MTTVLSANQILEVISKRHVEELFVVVKYSNEYGTRTMRTPIDICVVIVVAERWIEYYFFYADCVSVPVQV